MGTRTWTRRGVLTAAGRRRAGIAGQDTDIFGEDVPPNPTVTKYDGIRTRAINRIISILGKSGLRRPTAKQMTQLKRLAVALRQLDARLSEALGEDSSVRRWRLGTPNLPRVDIEDLSQRFVDSIIDEELAKGSRVPKGRSGKPVAIVMMGGPGSGKSTMRSQLFSDAGYVTVDNDAIKEKIPHYWIGVANSDSDAAKRVHGVAGDIVHELTRRATRQGYNVIIDGTGRHLDGMERTIKDLKKKGYEVRLMMPHTPVEEGKRRAANRAEQSGRWLNPSFLDGVYPDVAANFTALAPLADKAILHDSMTNQRIATYQRSGSSARGRMTYINDSLYDDFDQLAQRSRNYGAMVE